MFWLKFCCYKLSISSLTCADTAKQNPFVAEFSPFHYCISKQYSEERGQIVSTVLISEINMLMYIRRGSRYEGLDATFCALQMYQEYSYEADSCRV